MLKFILLAGVVLLCGMAGAAEVSQVTVRRDSLREILQDIKSIESLIIRQRMTLREALGEHIEKSRIGGAYRKLCAGLLRSFGSATEMIDKSGVMQELRRSELNERDRKILRDYFIGLAEGMDAEEIALISERYCSEITRLLAEVDSQGICRAKTLQKIWLLAGVGLAVILI